MISVFIPAYNAHSYIDRAVMSLINQSVNHLLKVIIINDGSEKDYQETIDKFSPYIHIEEIKHEKNMGVGYARQTALDNLDTKYFAFLDADDTYVNGMVFEILYNTMEEHPNYAAIFTDIYAEDEPYKYTIKDDTRFWVFSKIYRTSYIKEKGLSFPPGNANEDNIFNMALEMCVLNDDYVIMNYHSPSYLWHFAENSITRRNNFEFWFNQDLKGMVKGLNYIASNPNLNQEEFLENIILTFYLIYARYHDNLNMRKNEGFDKDMLNLAREIYSKYLSGYTHWYENDRIDHYLQRTIRDFQEGYRKRQMVKDFLKMVQ